MSRRQRKGIRWLMKTLFVFALGFSVNATLAVYAMDPAVHLRYAWWLAAGAAMAGAVAFTVGWATGRLDPTGDLPRKRSLVPWWAAILIAVLVTAWSQQPGKDHAADDGMAGFVTAA